MNCKKFEEAISADIDRLLSVDEKAELKAHLEECRSCRNTLDWMQIIQNYTEDYQEMEVPADFTEQVMSRIDELPVWDEKPTVSMNWFKAGMGLAVAAAAAVFLVLPSNGTGSNGIRPAVEEEVQIAKQNHEELLKGVMLASAKGDVQILKEGSFHWQSVAEDGKISRNDKLRTLAGSSVEVMYADGTNIRLRENSLIQLEENAIRVYHGDSWVKVIKKGSKFKTYTPNIVASVRGTAYSVGVQYNQKPYLEYLQEVAGEGKVLVSLSPEQYFQEFSSAAVNGLNNAALYSSVESDVKVYESSVLVESLNEKGEASGPHLGVIVEQGEMVAVSSSSRDLSGMHPSSMVASDYEQWALAVPEEIKTKERRTSDAEVTDDETKPVENTTDVNEPSATDEPGDEVINPADSYKTFAE
jgi:predicted anti-sigma-YlaC factor YlaD